MRSQLGFSLIEVLAALAIVAVAMTALMGRLGASADVQYTLASHSVMLDLAMNLLEEERNGKVDLSQERQGKVMVEGIEYSWRLWGEKTELDGFIRRNVSVKRAGEPEMTLFLYREQS